MNSESNIFVLLTRASEATHRLVNSRKMASRATVSPAARLCSCLPRKYNATGRSAKTRVCPRMRRAYSCPSRACKPARKRMNNGRVGIGWTNP